MQEERIDWMEAITPGSSAYLQRFTKIGSLHRRDDPPQYDPYSLAGPVEPDSSISNGSFSESVDVNTSLGSVGQHSTESVPTQPLNYMEPLSLEQRSHPPLSERSLSDVVEGVAVSPPSLFHSADAAMLRQIRKDEHPRQTSHRSTFTHSERERQPTNLLSRSFTERKGSEEKGASKNPDHLYELDGMGAVTRSVRPPLPDRDPPRAKPRKQPPPRNLSGSLSDSRVKASHDPDEEEPRYSARPGSHTDTLCKEPEYPAVSRPVPKQRVKPAPANMSDSSNKPVVAPRKNVCQSDRPQKQPDYLVLEGGDNGVESDGQLPNGSVSTLQSGSVAQSLPSVNELMVQNFSPGQLGMLISMLQQVQSEGKQQPAAETVAAPATQAAEQGANSTSQSDHNQIRKNFGT